MSLKHFCILTIALWAGMGCSRKTLPQSVPVATSTTDSTVDSSTKSTTKPVVTVAAPTDHTERIEMEVCADCHPEIVETYQKTGMGHSL